MPLSLSATQTNELEIKSVLLVDDDPELARTLKTLLESHNFVVSTAENGVTALKEVIALDFDVILCDLMMPNMPGDMFYLAVQKTKPELADRFVFITAHQGNARVDAFLQRVDGLVLFKPVLAEDLVRMISLVISRTEKKAA